MLIGLTGYSGVGKDTAAEYLVREHGFLRLSFADKLRDLAYAMNPSLQTYGVGLRVFVDRYGWEKAKRQIPGVREILQGVGQGHRDVFGEDFWLDQVLPRRKMLRVPVVVTDVRYPNEAARIRALGGKVVRIERHGHGPVNGHASEQELAADQLVTNQGADVRYMFGQLDLIIGIEKIQKEAA